MTIEVGLVVVPHKLLWGSRGKELRKRYGRSETMGFF